MWDYVSCALQWREAYYPEENFKKRDQHLVQAALKQDDVEACHPFLVCKNALLFWCFGLAFAYEKRVATPGCFIEVKAVLLLVLLGKYNYT